MSKFGEFEIIKRKYLVRKKRCRYRAILVQWPKEGVFDVFRGST